MENEINNKYKDRLFCRIFSDPAHKESLLKLFNVLNGTSYENADDLEINTLEDVVYMNMKNDVSCVVENHMALFEQQSTINPNMPLRGFMYFGRLYKKYFRDDTSPLYGKKLIKIPTPKFFVLYNGKSKAPDNKLYHLSDAFMIPDDSKEFEWTARFININPGHNDELVKACKLLSDYSVFVAKVREFIYDGHEATDAVEKSIDNLAEGTLKDYLITHRAEAKDLMLTEYNEEKVMEILKEQYKEEGFDEGVAKGTLDTVLKYVSRHLITPEQGAEDLGISVEQLLSDMKKNGYDTDKLS
jgi:hypothetical protein